MLKTKRLIIKSITDADREAVVSLLTNAIVKQTYMIPDFETEEEYERMFQRYRDLSSDESRFVRGVYLQGELIGIVNDVEIMEGSIELGYAFLPQYYNQGYATEMLGAVLADLKNRGYKQVRTGAFAENAASIRVMEKNGMQCMEETEQLEYRGVVHECVYYGMM